MYCAHCGSEAADGASFCSSCGKPLTPEAPSSAEAPTPPPVPLNAAPPAAPVQVVVQGPDGRPYGTPGTGALWLSIFGFCGITALLGVIFGIAARNEAKRRGVSSAKATWAIVIGLFWLLPVVISVFSLFAAQSSTTTPPSGGVAPPPAAASSTPISAPAPTFTDEVESALVRLKFTCDASKGVEEWVQCRKGTYNDPTYGASPAEMVNIWANQGGDGTQYVEGYVKAATFKELKKLDGKWTYSGATSNGTKDLAGTPSTS